MDDDDYEDLRKLTWTVHKGKNTIYAMHRTNTHGRFYMHKRITGYSKTDHKNGIGLDNRRENLREATDSQNNQNTGKTPGKFSSQYKGVSFKKNRNKWYARLQSGATEYNLGSFDKEEDAAHAYDEAAKIHFGEFARLNFPEK